MFASLRFDGTAPTKRWCYLSSHPQEGRVTGLFNLPNKEVFDACLDFCIEEEHGSGGTLTTSAELLTTPGTQEKNAHIACRFEVEKLKSAMRANIAAKLELAKERSEAKVWRSMPLLFPSAACRSSFQRLQRRIFCFPIELKRKVRCMK